MGVYLNAIADADIAKDQIFPASIVKWEIRENGGTSDQWQSIGDISEGTIDGTEVFQPVAGGAERQLGFMFTATASAVITGANMRAALANIASYVTDSRLTDINGHIWTFAQEDTLIRGDLTVAESSANSNDVSSSRMFNLRAKGFMTVSKWNSIFSTS